MKRFGLILLLFAFALPAISALNKKVSVQELKEMLVNLQDAKKDDAAVATELKQYELTEELTPSVMLSMANFLPGPLSTEQIYVMEVRSSVLAPPASDLPAAAPPDAAAQQALLAKASDYVSKVYTQLPHLSATRMTARFQDGIEAVHSYTGMAQGMSQDTDPLWATTSLNVRLINTRTLEVVDVISYQKQIVAHQIGAGVFKILNGNAFDLSAGEGALEPLQLGVRSVIERATVEMVANLYGMSGPEACMQTDPLGSGATTGVTGAFVPAYNNVETNNAATRQDPNRWNDRRDPPVDSVVRDRY